jgi:predicted ATPase/DNA-binding CsgD family transcriptional regulator
MRPRWPVTKIAHDIIIAIALTGTSTGKLSVGLPVGSGRRFAIVVSVPASHAGDPAGLPPVGGAFVGRERELDRVGTLLMGPARLVTLIGPGGIGKTRLAEEAARRLHRARHTPVFAVRLARLPKGSNAAAVTEAVTAAVLVEGFVGASAWDGAVQRLSPLDAADRIVPTMLIVDNCEHVLAGAGAVIADLLDAVPGLTILATSRKPIGWIDEQLVTVSPLSDTQSLELFQQRAALAGHPITEPDQVALAEQVCSHMHGHPLYIRLAAARIFYEPLPMLIKQLSGESDDARMRWRHGPRIGSEGRHRGIGDVIAWSYELCGEKQRLLFDRLSVFAPGHDVNPEDADAGVVDVGAELEAIEVVCADNVPIDGYDAAPSAAGADQAAVRLARTEIRGLLERLVEQSLVSIHITPDTMRYYLLETLRLFASDRLAERSTAGIDEPARLARRHCYYYRDKVLRAQAEWFGPAEQELLTWATGAWPNSQRAIDSSMQTGEAAVALQICVGLVWLRAPYVLGSLPEIRARMERALAAMPASEHQLSELELTAMAQTGLVAISQGRPEDAEDILERCVAACDTKAAHAGHWRDRPETDIGLPAIVDYAWGTELTWLRRDPRAIAVFARAREKFRSIADRGGESMSEFSEGLAACFFGSAEQAMSICQRHLERTTAAGAGWARAWAQLTLAIALNKHGDAEQALQLSRAALAYQVLLRDRWGPTWAVDIRMWSLARLITDNIAAGNARRSTLVGPANEIAYLAGGVKAQRARLGALAENDGPFADETRTAEEIAREVLGQATYANIKTQGSGLFTDHFELQQLALDTWSVSTSTPTPGNTSSWQNLSAAEQEVAILAAAGWPNSAIGVRRGTATRTTDAQMSSIFQKLTINSRDDIVRFIPQDQRNRVSTERSRIPRHSRDKPRSIEPRPQN